MNIDFLIQLVDETDPNFYVNVGLPKQGDVYLIHQFQNSWGVFFTDNSHWGIYTMNVSLSDGCLYMNPQIDQDPSNPSRMLQFRDRNVDVTQIKQGMTIDQIQAITTTKPYLTDPNIIGSEQSPNIIG